VVKADDAVYLGSGDIQHFGDDRYCRTWHGSQLILDGVQDRKQRSRARGMMLRDLMYQRGARVGLIPGRFVAQEGSLLDEAKRLV
jgi:hypothetical protein